LLSVTPTDPDWLAKALAGLEHLGYALIEGVVDAELLQETRERMYAVQQAIERDIAPERRAHELGVLRLMIGYDEHFLRFLELPEVLALVDAVLSPTAVLHVQNGFILPSRDGDGDFAQQSFHQDFPRHLDGYRAALNTLIAIDDFTPENGGTILAPGTHQRAERPADAFLAAVAEPVTVPAGSVIAFDSTLWHSAGVNRSGRDRLGINQIFSRSFFKQQIDYVRALGPEMVERQAPRTQQLLGWYTRVVCSLDEYYRPPDRRMYRAGQG
jgi:ectoine hydroxylase-related dioxygenase (phytanoyl-CoA dioxygenase family)